MFSTKRRDTSFPLFFYGSAADRRQSFFLRLWRLLGLLQRSSQDMDRLGSAAFYEHDHKLFVSAVGDPVESGRRICQMERNRLQMLLVSQHTSTANGMAIPEKKCT